MVPRVRGGVGSSGGHAERAPAARAVLHMEGPVDDDFARDVYRAHAGADRLVGAAGGRYALSGIQWNDALAGEVDQVLLSSEPYRFTEEHVDALERQVGKPVQLVDGEMMSWYGSRALQGIRYLKGLAAAG